MFVLLMRILVLLTPHWGSIGLASGCVSCWQLGDLTCVVGEEKFSVVLSLTLKVLMLFPSRMLSFKHTKEGWVLEEA